MNIFFAGQMIPVEILNNKKLADNEKLINTAGNNFYTNLFKGLTVNECRVTAGSLVYENVIDEYGRKTSIDGINFKLQKYSKNILKKYFNLFFGVLGNIYKWKLSDKGNSVIIVNCLRITQCFAAILAAKTTNTKTVAVVTDVPKYRVGTDKKSIVSKITDKAGSIMLKCYDGFVFLSEDMNPIVNTKNKPYVVVEGLINPKLFEGIEEEKYSTFTIMYAGALMRKYNIMSLVEAVLSIEDVPIKLILYGGGELECELRELSEKDSRIEYRGSVPHREILKEEKRVHLLVNPRSTDEEYTKLSFPSKNIEYMLSGTPVLFTKLKSMPKEYYDYIYTIDDETADGIAQKIKEIMSFTESELIKKGNSASDFAKKTKNDVYQSAKVKTLIEKILN